MVEYGDIKKEQRQEIAKSKAYNKGSIDYKENYYSQRIYRYKVAEKEYKKRYVYYYNSNRTTRNGVVVIYMRVSHARSGRYVDTSGVSYVRQRITSDAEIKKMYDEAFFMARGKGCKKLQTSNVTIRVKKWYFKSFIIRKKKTS
jgi:hypothetical protein